MSFIFTCKLYRCMPKSVCPDRDSRRLFANWWEKNARKLLQFLEWKQDEIPDQAHARILTKLIIKPQCRTEKCLQLWKPTRSTEENSWSATVCLSLLRKQQRSAFCRVLLQIHMQSYPNIVPRNPYTSDVFKINGFMKKNQQQDNELQSW